MESNSHYKQIIPYLVLTRGTGATARVLAYQRRAKHTEARLGGLWSVGFGGHVEPLDRGSETVATAGSGARGRRARTRGGDRDRPRAAGQIVLAGFINSDREDVSSVHFGVVFRVPLDDLPADDASILAIVDAQSEPHQSRWLAAGTLAGLIGTGQGPRRGHVRGLVARSSIAGLDIR